MQQATNLAEVGTLLGHGEVALLVGAAEEASVAHEVGDAVVLHATANPHPEEVLRLLALVDDLDRVRRLQQDNIITRTTLDRCESSAT